MGPQTRGRFVRASGPRALVTAFARAWVNRQGLASATTKSSSPQPRAASVKPRRRGVPCSLVTCA